MPALFWVSYTLLWLLVLLLGGLVVLLYRQLGSQLAAPAAAQPAPGAPVTGEGLPPGTPLPPLRLAWDGATTPTRWAPASNDGPAADGPAADGPAAGTPATGQGPGAGQGRGAGWLLLLTAPGCGTCKAISVAGAELAADWPDRTFVWLRRHTPDPAAATAPAGWRLADDPDGSAALALEAPAGPFAYVLQPDGTVAAAGRVTGPDDVRALLTTAPRPQTAHHPPTASASQTAPAGQPTPAALERQGP